MKYFHVSIELSYKIIHSLSDSFRFPMKACKKSKIKYVESGITVLQLTPALE